MGLTDDIDIKQSKQIVHTSSKNIDKRDSLDGGAESRLQLGMDEAVG